MKLLIITQKADSSDPILGFFHGWLQEFAKRSASLTVIAQSVGTQTLPQTVRVLSLGKDAGLPRWRQILRFWKLCFVHRQQYDAVFVHMTPVWMVLGAPLWILLGKRRYLWYEIRRGSWMLTLSLIFVRKVFSATPSGLPLVSSKNIVVGHGIDTDQFSPKEEKREADLIATIGRITPIKYHDLLLTTFFGLPAHFRYVLGGGTITKSDEETLRILEQLIAEHGAQKRVQMGFLSREEVVDLLRRTTLFLHACGGGLDKVVLEAMSCGCLIVSSSEAAKHVLPPECLCTDDTMLETAQKLLDLPEDQKKTLREMLRRTVVKHHSLPKLMQRLVEEMQILGK